MNTLSVRQGYFLAGASVLLVTLAQLNMKWGMSHLPLLNDNVLTFQFWWDTKVAVLLVAIGIFFYLLSMLCWLQALTALPLNKAYPLLSISYALVYLATLCLPWFQEAFSLSQSLGVVLITAGVVIVVKAPAQK